MMLRRSFLRLCVTALASIPVAAQAFHIDHVKKKRALKTALVKKPKRLKIVKAKRPVYKGREDVAFFSFEKPGTIIIKTKERALYRVLGGGKATRYLVAVGKEGFSWAGVAKIAMKREKPIWTPPPEMIERTPKYAKWAGGMPGGLPENPLGAAALYLYKAKVILASEFTAQLFQVQSELQPLQAASAC